MHTTINTTITSEKIREIIKQIFTIDEAIRYVAILLENGLFTEQKNNIQDTSSSDSDKYEELFVNPALLKLTTQRGNLDCGGLNYLLIKYGHFYQWVAPFYTGHLSICIEKNSDPLILIHKISEMINKDSDSASFDSLD